MGSVLSTNSCLGVFSTKIKGKVSPYWSGDPSSGVMSEVEGDFVRPKQPVLVPDSPSQIWTGRGVVFLHSEGQFFGVKGVLAVNLSFRNLGGIRPFKLQRREDHIYFILIRVYIAAPLHLKLSLNLIEIKINLSFN